MWGLPVSGVPGHYLGASLGLNSPLALNIFEQRLLFKHGHYVEKCRYCYCVLSESGIPELMERGGGGGLRVGAGDFVGWG